MFFPWGKDQKLLADQNNFDHGPYERMKKYAPDFDVMLWDFYATEKLCLAHYPEIWKVALSLPRPMMLVNTLRWLMVYHHGGISWQYDMNPLRPMAAYLPSSDKECRVFTEFEHDEAGRRLKIDEPIRNGEPEESIRIPSQVFSAVPRHRYMKAVVDFIHERSKKYTFKRDYDCQFITGNAAASTAYDLFGKNDPTVERVGAVETRQMIKIIYQGTWRTEEAKADVGEEKGSGFQVSGFRLKKIVKSFPGYNWFRPHLHEVAFRELRDMRSGIRNEGYEALATESQIPNTGSVCRVDPVMVQAVADLIRDRGFRSVLNYPEPHFPGLREALGTGVRYIGGDMVRGTDGATWMNLMFSRVPRVECVVMRNVLDHIGTEDVLTLIRRLREAGVKWIISTDYPCLNTNWDNYAGEWRPVSLAMKPYVLKREGWNFRDEDVGRRTDREMGLYRL